MIAINYKRGLDLAINLALSDFRNKHARSVLGLFWLALTPLGMLLVYWVVFGHTLSVSWPGLDGRTVGFVLPFFIGYSVFIFFSDIITSSLNIFISKKNYVKKSPIPLWVLWAANFLRAFMQAGIYLIIIVVLATIQGYLTIAGLLLFLSVMASFMVFIAAVSLTLSAIGPFFNDLSEASRIFLRVLFYMGPITYPLAMVPLDLRGYLWMNPLTHIIVPARNALIFASMPDFFQFSGFVLFSIVLMAMSCWFFHRASEGIVNVL